MRQGRPQGPASVRPVRVLWSGRSPSKSDRRCRVNRPSPSFLYDLATDIGPPIKGSGISCPPLFRALPAKQLLQCEMRNHAPDDDFPVTRFDIEALAVAEPGGLDDFAREPNGQVFAPLADGNLRHRTLQFVGIF